MYGIVTGIGFFPITVSVLLAAQRRLRKNLAQAKLLNTQLDRLHEPAAVPAEPALPTGIVLKSEVGKESLSLLPNQLLYIESAGNYIEVRWLNFMFPQKTILRSYQLTLSGSEQEVPVFR